MLELPEASVTVVVAVKLPMSLHVTVEGLIEKLEPVKAVQLSEEPLSIAFFATAMLPAALSCIVLGWQTATGGVTSVIVTVAVQLDEAVVASVTVKVTVFPLRLLQVKLV